MREGVKRMLQKRSVFLLFMVLLLLIVLTGWGVMFQRAANTKSDMSHAPSVRQGMGRERGMMDMGGMMSGMMDMGGMMSGPHGATIRLRDSKGTHPLAIPSVLQPTYEHGEAVYTLRAEVGETELIDGIKTETYGYNGSFLGPVLRFKKGEHVRVQFTNNLREPTTVHWHGLIVPPVVDGGPENRIMPGEATSLTFDVLQDPATLWFHPHPHGQTSEQVYKGLAGLVYIDDDEAKLLNLPETYGQNDIPLIFQDRLFTSNGQLDYWKVANADGTLGDTLLINGTVDPILKVQPEPVRFRLLNGSNARTLTIRLNTGDAFMQVATDGGLLDQPQMIQQITLSPAERAEIVVDFGALKDRQSLALVDDEGVVLLPLSVQKAQHSVQAKPIVSNPSYTSFLSSTENADVLLKESSVQHQVVFFGMMQMVQINGKKYDPRRVDFKARQGKTEIWEFYNKPDMMGGMVHPVHLHGAQFQIISRNGERPPVTEQGFKDTFAIAPGERVRVLVTFQYTGTYMLHCHLLEHEDQGMMATVLVQ